MEDDGAARELVGVYTLCHDGWYGALTLAPSPEGDLAGSFVDVRTGRTSEVRAQVGRAGANSVEVTIYRYDQAPSQTFSGYRFGPRGESFAGFTSSRGVPYGFFARRAGFPHLGQYGDGRDAVVGNDFVGRYTAGTDVGLGTVELRKGPRGFQGRCTFGDGPAESVAVEVGGAHDHRVELTFSLGGQPFEVTGYLFTRPKSAVAGTAIWRGDNTGFYMTKFRGADG